jgi:heme a synthase
MKFLHIFTIFVTAATLLLIVAGALVTSNDAGLAAPDWPLSYGQVFPRMVGNLFYEHGHRMIATTVGILVILLNIFMWKFEKRQWVRRLSLFALLMVIVQGLLGGLTVLLQLPLAVSVAHACLAQLFFCTLVSLSLFTSPSWEYKQTEILNSSEKVHLYASLSALLVFVQLLIGAILRHSATWDKYLPTSLVILHITGAFAVLVAISLTVHRVFRGYSNNSYLKGPAKLALWLLAIQLLLGVATLITRTYSPDYPQPSYPMVPVTVAHVACGALVLATTVILALRAYQTVLISRRELPGRPKLILNVPGYERS